MHFSLLVSGPAQSFVRAAEKFGRTETEKIAGEMEGKTREEVERYSKVRRHAEKMCHSSIIIKFRT